jgi:hypothetical protein
MLFYIRVSFLITPVHCIRQTEEPKLIALIVTVVIIEMELQLIFMAVYHVKCFPSIF